MKLHHFVPSWTLEENFGACSNADFWKTCCGMFQDATPDDHEIHRRDLITKKFVFAGHVARFMFKYTESLSKTQFTEATEDMNGINSLENEVRNTRSSGPVNTLIARFHEEKNGVTPQQVAEFPSNHDLEAGGTIRADFWLLDAEMESEQRPTARLISDFASKEIIKKIPTTIERLRNVARALSNKVIEGYAFEEQLKKSLREAVNNPGRSLVVNDEARPSVHTNLL